MSNPTELSDLDAVHLANLVRAAGYEMAASEYQHAWNLAKGGPGLEDRISKSEKEFLAAVERITDRRAQPEGEAPQAVYQMRNKQIGGEWYETDADGATCIKRMPHWADAYEFRTLYTAPAAQHAESGAPDIEAAFAEFCDREGYPSDGPMDEALRAAFREGAALAAQSQGAPAARIIGGQRWSKEAEMTEGWIDAQQAAAPGAEPVEPPRMTTDESREYLVKFMEKHFTDKTYHRYIRGERGNVNLAGDFAWQMARALRMLEAAPSAPGTPEAPGLPGQSDEDAYASSAYRHFMSLDTFKAFRREYENRAAQLDGGLEGSAT